MHNFTIYSDGGCKGNGTQNTKGYGSLYILYNDQPVPIKFAILQEMSSHAMPTSVETKTGIIRFEFAKATTNSAAELATVLMGMRYISILEQINPTLKDKIRVEFRIDSQFVFGQLVEGHKLKAAHLKEYKKAGLDWIARHPNAAFVWITGDQMKATPIAH